MTIKSPHQLIILGSGTSTGIPMLGCSCAVCHSTDPRDQRWRTSALLKTASGKVFLVDSGPDLRAQLLAHQVQHLDGVILTHDHADHLHGIDDLRPFTFPPRGPLPIFAPSSTLEAIRQRFPYLFDPNAGSLGGGKPELEFFPLELDPDQLTNVDILGESFSFFMNPHGQTESLALVHGGLAYIIDCHAIASATIKKLRALSLDLLIIDCVQEKPHQTHLWFEEALRYTNMIRPLRAGLIHMGHKVSHQGLERELEKRGLWPQIFVTHDGLELSYCTETNGPM